MFFSVLRCVDLNKMNNLKSPFNQKIQESHRCIISSHINDKNKTKQNPENLKYFWANSAISE